MKPIFYSKPTFKDFTSLLKKKKYSQIVFIVDTNTHEKCLPLLLADLETEIPIEIIETVPGESNKNLETCYQVWMALTELNADRNNLIVNVGGGMITDLGSFVASTYLRGIDFVNFPTTLLGMVDASLGGKTGVDLENLKNRIGTFAFAEKVYIIPEFLQTLALSEIESGFAEMLKHSLIADKELFLAFEKVETISLESILPYIEKSVEIKHKVFTEDPKEKGLRKILNFGHTIGHAIETHQLQKQKPIPHGFAVAIGMYYEVNLSMIQRKLTEKQGAQIQEVLKKHYKIPVYSQNEVNHFIELMRSDKKNNSKEINFTLLDDIGAAIFDQNLSEKQVINGFFRDYTL